uniref:Putative secreted protein n=1 Tax=Ixodes ricinus TaxID=34613 RepID=A0A147BXA3_IXORI
MRSASFIASRFVQKYVFVAVVLSFHVIEYVALVKIPVVTPSFYNIPALTKFGCVETDIFILRVLAATNT